MHGTSHERVSHGDAPVLDENVSHGPFSLIELSLEHGPHSRAGGVRFQLSQIRNEQDHLEEQVESFALLGGDLDENGVATPIFRNELELAELLLDPLGIGVGFIDLVDRDEKRHSRGPRVIDGFFRLRHHAVIGRHYEHDEIRHRSARARIMVKAS